MSLFRPETINIQTLECVSYDARDSLPPIAAIYFVLSPDGEILYIGKATNLYLRWKSHHRRHVYALIHAVRIAWIPISNRAKLVEIEQMCIQHFSPVHNGSKYPKRADEKRSTSFRLTHEAKSLLGKLSNLMGMPQTAVCETLIREKARREKVHTQTRSSRDDPTEPLAASVGR